MSRFPFGSSHPFNDFISTPFDDFLFYNDPFFYDNPRSTTGRQQQQLTASGNSHQSQPQGQMTTSAGGPNQNQQQQLQRRSGNNWDLGFSDPFSRRGMKSIKLDVHEDKNAYRVSAEIPGMDKKDIQLNINDGYLTISGEKKYEHKEENKDSRAVRIERSYGHVSRSIALPKNIDETKIQAKHHDGVLEVVLPKSEHNKQSQITIQ